MSRRGLAILAALVALLAVALWRFKGEGRTPAPPAGDAPLVAAFKGDAVRSIAVACQDTAFTLARSAAGAWTLASLGNTEADPREAVKLVEALQDARVRKVIAEKGADAAAFGLEPAVCDVSVVLDGDTAGRHVAIGRTSPVGTERYASAVPGRVVFVDGSLFGAVARPATAFRERRLLPADAERVTRLEIERPDATIRIVRDKDAWRMEAPVADLADPSVAEQLVRAATGLTLVDTGAKVAPPRETSPSHRLLLRVEQGGAASRREALVAAAGIDGKRVAWRAGGSFVGLVDASALTDLERPPAAYRDRQVLSFSEPDATRLVLTRGGQTVTVERAKEGAPWTARDGAGPATPADERRVRSLLDRLRGLRAADVLAVAPSAASGTLGVFSAHGPLATVTWGSMPPENGEESLWATTPARQGIVFRVPASTFGPLPQRASDLAAAPPPPKAAS